MLSWIGLCIIVRSGARRISHVATRPFWRPFRNPSCACRSERFDHWAGTAMLSSDFSVGNSDAITWKPSRAGRAELFPPLWQPGDAHKVNSLQEKCSHDRRPSWMMPPLPPCAVLMPGSRSACADSLPETTGPGFSPLATSFAPSSRPYSSKFGRSWSLACNNGCQRVWCTRLRTPSSTWPRPCGTRILLWCCSRGLAPPSNYASSNGSRSMSDYSSWLCRGVTWLHHDLPMPRWIVMPSPEAQTILHLSEQEAGWHDTSWEAVCSFLDRPGPKSGGKRRASSVASRTGSLTAHTVDMYTILSWVPLADVRVEGRFGCTPSEAASLASLFCCAEVKHCDPFEIFGGCPQGPGSPGTLFVQYMPCISHSDSRSTPAYGSHIPVYHLPPTPAHSDSTFDVRGHPCWPTAPGIEAETRPKPTPLRDMIQSLVQCLGTVILSVCVVLCVRRSRRSSVPWRTFRIVPGQYRRRPLKGPSASEAQCQHARLPVQPPQRHDSPLRFRRPPLSGITGPRAVL